MISEERLLALCDFYWNRTTSHIETQNRVAFARAVEREAYEAAAKVCDDMAGRKPFHCAAAIRALKGA